MCAVLAIRREHFDTLTAWCVLAMRHESFDAVRCDGWVMVEGVALPDETRDTNRAVPSITSAVVSTTVKCRDQK